MTIKYPKAIWKPLGPQTEPMMTAHDVICVHTMVGYLSTTNTYFRSGNGSGYNGTESHFGIGGKWGLDVRLKLDGSVYQWQDLLHQADANLNGGGSVISIETADNAPRYAKDIDPWDDRQVQALVDLISWLCSKEAHENCPSSWRCHKEGIPAELIPDTKPGRRGLAYHAQGIPPNLVCGGVAWSGSAGKECPGPVRIKQFVGDIIPRVRQRMKGSDEVSKADVVSGLRTNIAKNRNGKYPKVDTLSVADFIEMGDQKLDDLKEMLIAQTTLVKATNRAVVALSANSAAGVKEAFDAGIAELQAQLSAIEARLVLE